MTSSTFAPKLSSLIFISLLGNSFESILEILLGYIKWGVTTGEVLLKTTLEGLVELWESSFCSGQNKDFDKLKFFWLKSFILVLDSKQGRSYNSSSSYE